jgi:UDP-galactopyranose mutase
LLDFLLSGNDIHTYISWYYTPMALRWSSHLRPILTVYDCMDELSAFAGAPAGMADAERSLLKRTDLVLTGGHSLYCAKRALHPHVHEFASGVDVDHFSSARRPRPDPIDQVDIPHPRIGFFGVLDERLDRELLAGMAEKAPGWHFVMIGPVTKIDPKTLPAAPNLHYLGAKAYAQLPDYIAHWEVAMLPFARNDATRYISPTKTPEYLAAGRPVVSTSIADVVTPYREQQLVRIADTPEEFVDAIREALCEQPDDRVMRADAMLQRMSWDNIWSRMSHLIDEACRTQSRRRPYARATAAETRSSRL